MKSRFILASGLVALSLSVFLTRPFLDSNSRNDLGSDSPAEAGNRSISTVATPQATPTRPVAEPAPGVEAPLRPAAKAIVEALPPQLGDRWKSGPEGSPFAAFSDWAERYQKAAPEDKPVLEKEGQTLATERRIALYNLIQSDPKTALGLTPPLEVREALPNSVSSLLENRVSGRGELSVLAAYPIPGQELESPAIRRTLSMAGQEYRAFVYGVREAQPTKQNLPVHGIAVDDVIALSENPVRRLERVEIERLQSEPPAEAVCGVSSAPVTVADEPTPVDVGGEIAWICRYSHAEPLNSQLQLAASQPGTGVLGDGGLLESPYTEGRKRVIMIRVAFSNLPTPDISSNSLVTVHSGIDSYWRANSYGKTFLAPLKAGSEIVQVTLTQPSTAYDGDAGALRTDVRAAATAAGIDLGSYDFDIIYTGGGRPSFDFGGLGYVGGPGSWVVGASTSISCHELGHNLGAPHANFWDTGGQTSIGSGDNQEYGDPYDVMGGGSASGVAAGHYVTKFKWRMGWILDADFPRITASGTHRIYTHDHPDAKGLRGLRFAKDGSLEYYLEFRQLYTGNRWMTDGIGLRWGNPNSWSSQLIDTTAGSSSGKTDSAIVIGRTFSDRAAGVHVTPIGKGHTFPESIDVVVQLGPQTGNLPPTGIVTANTSEASPGTPVTFTATATDPNGDRLAYYWEYSGTAAGYSTDNQPVQTVLFDAEGEHLVRCVISDMRGGVVQQTLVVRVGNPTTHRISGHVVDNANRPIVGALVTATGPSTRSVFTDSDGSYVIPGLSAGTYTVTARDSVAAGVTFVQPYFGNPVVLGPSFTSADFVGIPGSLNIYAPLVNRAAGGWRYNDTGTDLGTAWRAAAFSDAAWASGTAPLGYPSGSPITTVISYGPNSSSKYPTYYFRRHFNVSNPAEYTSLLVELLRDDSAAVYLNGVEVVRDNLDANATYGTFAQGNSGADGYIQNTVPASALVAGDNVLAVEVHQANATSSDIVMDVAVSGLSVSNVTGLNLAYLTSPANGTRFVDPGSIPLEARVLRDGAAPSEVNFYVNGSLVGQSVSAPFAATWNSPTYGTHQIQAVAVLGSTQITSPPVRIQVGGPLPPSPNQAWISPGSQWSYLAQSSAAPADWATPEFDDSAWPSGSAELGFGDGDEATIVPGGPSGARFSTVYFRKSFVIEDPAGISGITARLRRDDGAVVYLNGTELIRDNMPAGTVSYGTLAADAADDGDTLFTFERPATGLVAGVNVIAVEVHQSSLSSSDLSFDFSIGPSFRTNRLISPIAGTTVELPGSVVLEAEATLGSGGGITRMEFFVDGLGLGEDTTAPYRIVWANPTVGQHVLTARAVPSSGAPIESGAVTITVNQPSSPTALISFGDVWKYRDDGANLGATWTGRFFNDGAWKSGAAKLGYGTTGLSTTVSFGTNSASRHITTYFRKSFTVTNPAEVDALFLRLLRDDGAVVYLNGSEILRDNLQSGPVSWNSTALTALGTPEDTTPVDVTLPQTALVAGTNVLAVEVHQASPSSSDLAFDLALAAVKRTNATEGLYLYGPADQSRFNANTPVPVQAHVTGNPAGPVEFFANGASIGQDSQAPYALTWNNPLPGTYSLTARASIGGVEFTSPAVSITVGDPPPPITPVLQNLVSQSSGWRYLDSATAPANDWVKRSFDDSAWPSGPARFGFGLDGERTTLTPGRTTYYFRKWFNVANPALFSSLMFYLVRDDGAVVYLNGVEVFRSNMPVGGVTQGTLAASTVNTPDETTFFETILNATGSGLYSSSNLLAVEVHQAAANSSDLGFDLALYGSGTTEPRIYLGTPVQDSQVTYGTTLTVEALAHAGTGDSVERVEFFVDNVKVGESSAAPYRFDWTLTEFGPRVLMARMLTTGGKVLESAPVRVTVTRESIATLFIPSSSTWKYLDDGSSLGGPWTQTGFNDTAWPVGTARFGYGGDGEVTTLRQTRANDGSRIITFFFRKSFTVQPGAVYTNLSFQLLRDDGAVVYLNGREVFRSNMPAGTITAATTASSAIGGADEQTFFPTTITTTNLPVGLNVVAVEVHQQSATSSDVGFDLQFQASGFVDDVTPPNLQVDYDEGLVSLSWPATFAGWQVYVSPALGEPWAPLGIAPFVVNGRNVVSFPPGTGNFRFYRLGKP